MRNHNNNNKLNNNLYIGLLWLAVVLMFGLAIFQNNRIAELEDTTQFLVDTLHDVDERVERAADGALEEHRFEDQEEFNHTVLNKLCTGGDTDSCKELCVDRGYKAACPYYVEQTGGEWLAE